MEKVNLNLNLEEYLNNTDHCHHSYRKLKPEDINYFYNWIDDEETIRYSLTKFHQINSKAEINDWYNNTIQNPRCFSLGIITNDGELIGHIGISGINKVDNNGEYFILIGNKKYWNKGIASEATKDIVELGFKYLNLNRITLTASSSNVGALKAYKKAGFKEEGCMRNAFFRNNKSSDKIIMGLLKYEFTSNEEEKDDVKKSKLLIT